MLWEPVPMSAVTWLLVYPLLGCLGGLSRGGRRGKDEWLWPVGVDCEDCFGDGWQCWIITRECIFARMHQCGTSRANRQVASSTAQYSSRQDDNDERRWDHERQWFALAVLGLSAAKHFIISGALVHQQQQHETCDITV